MASSSPRAPPSFFALRFAKLSRSPFTPASLSAWMCSGMDFTRGEGGRRLMRGPPPKWPESLWILVGLQADLDGLRAYLVAHPGKSISLERIDALTGQVLATVEWSPSAPLSDDELRAARYRVDLIAVAWGLIRADVLASAGIRSDS